MAGEIIRLGDPTSHGGKVIEGSPVDICHGKPIAYLGHQTYCPQCKGTFPIIDGAPTTTFYGKGVALAGMKTACGAVLIATQITDIVATGGGGAGAASVASTRLQASNPAPTSASATTVSELTANAARVSAADEFDQYFHVLDISGAPMADWPYRIEMANGVLVHGRTDSEGKTKKVAAKATMHAILHVYEPDAAPINPNWDR
jgi:uncharacterized Zn-binding protein involved in type VI secretion